MSEIKVACVSLTNTIYAGTVLKKPPNCFGKNKTDVTLDALEAVAQHVLNFGEPVILSTPSGRVRYKITVENIATSNLRGSDYE